MRSELLRVYDPPECDEHGVPLDWERCRTCEGEGRGLWRWPRPHEVVRVGEKIMDPVSRLRTEVERRAAKTCPTCGGHGSLKAAVLAAPEIVARQTEHGAEVFGSFRCEGCGHPMTDGTWVGDFPRLDLLPGLALSALREGVEPTEEWFGAPLAVHWSPCDEGCTHDDRHGRLLGDRGAHPGETVVGNGPGYPPSLPFEASWRSVDVRTLGWAADLRPEKLAVLCLRCWAERGRT